MMSMTVTNKTSNTNLLCTRCVLHTEQDGKSHHTFAIASLHDTTTALGLRGHIGAPYNSMLLCTGIYSKLLSVTQTQPAFTMYSLQLYATLHRHLQ